MRRLLLISMLTVLGNAELENNRAKRNSRLASPLLRFEPLPDLDVVQLYEFPRHNNVFIRTSPNKIIHNTNGLDTKNVVISNNPQRVITDYKLIENVKSTKTQTIMNLFKKGIHLKKQLFSNFFAPPEPKPIMIIRDQAPAVKEVEEFHPLEIKYTKATEVKTHQVVVPKEVVTDSEIVQPKYSYHQTSKDGTVMSYQFEDNPNVIVTETETMPALPPYIKSRFEQIVGGVVQTELMAPGVPLSVTQETTFGPSKIVRGVETVIFPSQRFTVPIIPQALSRFENIGYFEGGISYGPPVEVQEDIPVSLYSQSKIIKTLGPKGDVNVKITKNDPSLNCQTSLGISNMAFTGINNFGGISCSGYTKLPTPPSLNNVNSNSDTNLNIFTGQSPPKNVVGDVSTGNYVNNKNCSSFGYTDVNTIFQCNISQVYSTNTNLGRMSDTVDAVSNQELNYHNSAPSGNSNMQSSHINVILNQFSPQDAKRLTIDTSKTCIEGDKLTGGLRCPESTRVKYGNLESSPIVVSESSPPVYNKINADGLSINTIGNQNQVTVNVNDRRQRNRGDIPSAAYK